MKEVTPNKLAFAAFIQALAVAIINFDDLPPESRTTENFMRSFDGTLDATLEEYESGGHLESISGISGSGSPEFAREVNFIREGLKHGLNQVREHRRQSGKPS